MKLRYRLFRKKSGIFFLEDRVSRKQGGLKTRDKTEASRILPVQLNRRRGASGLLAFVQEALHVAGRWGRQAASGSLA